MTLKTSLFSYVSPDVTAVHASGQTRRRIGRCSVKKIWNWIKVYWKLTFGPWTIVWCTICCKFMSCMMFLIMIIQYINGSSLSHPFLQKSLSGVHFRFSNINVFCFRRKQKWKGPTDDRTQIWIIRHRLKNGQHRKYSLALITTLMFFTKFLS